MAKKKKKRKQPKSSLDILEVYNMIRQIWTINPKTRVKPNKKKYNRSKEKAKLKKEIRGE